MYVLRKSEIYECYFDKNNKNFTENMKHQNDTSKLQTLIEQFLYKTYQKSTTIAEKTIYSIISHLLPSSHIIEQLFILQWHKNNIIT